MKCFNCGEEMKRESKMQLKNPFIVGQPVCHESDGWKCPECGSIKFDKGYNPFPDEESFNVWKEMTNMDWERR